MSAPMEKRTRFILPKDKVKKEKPVVRNGRHVNKLKVAGITTIALFGLTVIGSSAYGIYSFNEQYQIRFQSPVQTPVWIEKREFHIVSPLPEEKTVKNDSTRPTETPKVEKQEKTSFIPKAEAQEKVTGIYSGKVSHYSHAGCLGCGEKQIMGNGRAFDENAMTLAFPCELILNKTVRYGTMARITNMDNGKSVMGEITDCGGFSKYNRIADLSLGMANTLGTKTDVTNVKIELL